MFPLPDAPAPFGRRNDGGVSTGFVSGASRGALRLPRGIISHSALFPLTRRAWEFSEKVQAPSVPPKHRDN